MRFELLGFLGCVLLARVTLADIYECKGIIQNRPCASGGSEKWLEETKNEEVPADLSQRPPPTPRLGASLKRLVKFADRSRAPQVSDFDSRDTGRSRVKLFRGTVFAYNPVALSIEYNISGNVHRGSMKFMKGKLCLEHFPPSGNRCHVEFESEIPADAFTFQIKAENMGDSADLRGCCSWHSGVQSCQADGSILCNDQQRSPTCRCR